MVSSWHEVVECQLDRCAIRLCLLVGCGGGMASVIIVDVVELGGFYVVCARTFVCVFCFFLFFVWFFAVCFVNFFVIFFV